MTGEPTLYGRMELRLTDAEKRLAKFQGTLDKSMGTMERRTAKAAATMQTSLSNSATAFSTKVAASAAASVLAMASFTAILAKTKAALTEFGDIADKSAQTGLDAEFFQSLSYQASLAGVGMDELAGALSTFNKNSGLAVVNKGKMVSALKALNPELLENIKNAKSQEERVRLVAEAMDRESDASRKAAIASAAFGDVGAKLVAVFKGGAAAIDATAAKARALGIIVDRDLIARADELGDQFDTASKVIDVQFKQAMVKLAPILVSSTRLVAKLASDSSGAGDGIDSLSRAVDGIGRIFEATANGPLGKYVEKLSQINELVQKLLPGIDGLKRLPENIDLVASWLEGGAKPSVAASVRNDIAGRIDRSVNLGIDTPAVMSDAELKTVNDLLKLLRENRATAEDIDTAFAKLGGRFQTLRDQVKPFVDQLRDAATHVTKLDEITITGPRGPSEGAMEAQRSASAEAFLQERTAIELRTEKEKELAALTAQLLKDAKDAGQAITEAEAAAAARLTIAKRTAISETDGAISGFVDRVVGAESGGDANAKNPLSSATGLGQFIESTWIDQFRKNFPDRAANMSREAILAMRSDAATSRQLIESYARENAAVLQAAGISVAGAADEYKLQLAHFLGPQGAISILKAAPSAPVSGLLDASAIKANQSILGGGTTAADVIAYAQKRAGMTTPGTQAIDSRVDFEKQLEQERQRIELLKQETGLRAQLNPLVEDYGRGLSEIEKASQLFKMAQDEGTAAGKELSSVQQLLKGDLSGLTPEAQAQAMAMRELAVSHGTVTASGNQLAASQEQLKTSLAESSALGKDVFGGMIRDMRDGASAAEILHNALIKISDKLIDVSLTRLFDGAVAGSGQGLLGGLFKAFGFAEGGYTGPGSKKDIAGVVHAGEYVIPKRTVDQLGVPALEAMFRGYANGGPVRMPSVPSLSGFGRRESGTNVRIGVDVTGARGNREIMDMVEAGVRQGISRYDKVQAPSTAIKAMGDYQDRIASGRG